MTEFRRKVYNITRRIPRGKVATYAAVAQTAGRPGAARAVGNALHKNPFRDVPCHRVVRSDGRTGGFARGTGEKMRILRHEGVSVINGRVDLERYGFHGKRDHS